MKSYLLFTMDLNVEALRKDVSTVMRARYGMRQTDLAVSLDDCINPYPMQRNFRAHCSDLQQIVTLIYERFGLSDFATVYEIEPSSEAVLKMTEVFLRVSGDQARFRRDMIAHFMHFPSPDNSRVRDVVKVAESHRHLLIEYQI